MKNKLKEILKMIKNYLIKEVMIKRYIKILNYLVLFIIYIINNNIWIETITGLYIFSLISFDLYSWFIKK